MTGELFANEDAAGKRKMCAKLNADATARREALIDKEIHIAAAQVLRSRMIVVDSAAAVKSFMESSSKEGLKARVIFVDISQLPELQITGQWAKTITRQPTQQQQKDSAKNVAQIRVTPITGGLLGGAAHTRLDDFFHELYKNYPPPKYEKTLFVPIDWPPAYDRAIKSATSRALGPLADREERSGVQFIFRAVGGRGARDE